MNGDRAALPRLVLVGGGHAHVQVLHRFAMDRPAAEVTLVIDQPIAVYSGMVPGFVAGMYRREELEIDLLPLARRAGAQVIFARATRVDALGKRLELEGRPTLPYDLISFNIGSSVFGLDLPGVRERAIATRPIAGLIGRVAELLERWLAPTENEGAPKPQKRRVVVVGAGSGGVELAFSMHVRLREAGIEAEVTLVQTGLFILPGYSLSFRQKVEEAAARAGIKLSLGHRALRVVSNGIEGDCLHLDSGAPLPFDALFWVTGAAPHPVFRQSGLKVDEKGFLLVRKTLQTLEYDDIFAVGDCATLASAPATAKAGVYAVRQGPVVEANLRAALAGAGLAGAGLEEYEPQSDFLTLLNLGDGTAIGGKWGIAFEGRWVMRLKDRIDRRFMKRFQVLQTNGELSQGFQAMEMDPMFCGGCAAKVGQNVLERVFRRLGPPPIDGSVVLGLEQPDDAAAFRTPGGDLVLVTLDAFKAFTQDAWLVGKVAAINAISDLYAKGAQPVHALALVVLPEGLGEERSEELLFQILEGIRSVIDPLGVSLLGGHTTVAAEMMVGLSIDGVLAGDELLRKGQLELGQKLILTKRLGTGVLFHADMNGWVRGPWLQAAIQSMLRPNADAAKIARQTEATAATDVTGYGLLGHLGEMARASSYSVALDVDALPHLDGALELFARGFQSTFHPQNEKLLRGTIVDEKAAHHANLPLLSDPQTSGGLLIAVATERAEETLNLLHQAGDKHACIVGEVLPARLDGAKIHLRCE